MQPNIIILLSSYNGEKYISQQLDSLLGQKDISIKVYIRDDGSTDRTASIISQYEDVNENIIFLNKKNRTNLGFSLSFLTLMAEVMSIERNAQYFMFCDQDDIWMEHKVFRAYQQLTTAQKEKKLDNEIPAMYYANKNWVDNELNKYGEDSFLNCHDDYMDVFYLPPVYGCTMMFNRKLGDLTLAKNPPADLLYDVWMYRIACMVESVIVADREPNILYRRHQNNASNGDCKKKFSPLKAAISKMGNKNDFHGMRNYLSEIRNRHESLLLPEQKELISLIETYDKHVTSAVKLLLWKRARIRGLKEYIVWAGRIVLKAI